jgi:hypothetical protein
VGTSNPQGQVDILLLAPWCRTVGDISDLLGLHGTPPEYNLVAALFVEKEGYATRIVDCTKGGWTEHERQSYDDLHATLDLGQVRLTREK